MSINDFIEMTIFLCLICFVDEHVFFIFFFAFYAETQDGCQQWLENDFLGKVASRLCR